VAESPLLDAASRIADGDGVDWLSITATLNDDQSRAVADELAIVQQIAAGHRQLHQLLPVPSDTPAHLMPDRARWGHLDLLNVVGRGSYGIVYRAWDTRLERLVALKLFHGASNPDSVMQEGRMLARVRHENVVSVYGADVIDGVAGIWMELVHGETLDRIVKKTGPLSAREAASVGADVARALGAVHASGLLHCDIKAQNVVRETSGRVVLMDMGASRLVPELRDMDQQLTDVAGTPRYMAPELFAAGATPTKESDIYSLGILIYHLVTGQFPVDGKTLGELKRAHEAKKGVAIHDARHGLPRPLADVVTRSIDRDPALRPATTVDIQSTLSMIASEPIVVRVRWWSRLARAAASLFSFASSEPRKRVEGARRKLESAVLTEEALQAALTNRPVPRRYSSQPVAASKLGAVLEFTFGASPSGALRHPINAYVAVFNIDGLPGGVYQYDSTTKELIELQKPIGANQIAPLLENQAALANVAAIAIMCPVLPRATWRSPNDRAYRMALIDAGHLGQTFALVATALGLAPFTTMAFNEGELSKLIGLDGVREFPIYVAGIGQPDRRTAERSTR
jgi:SagB-type dehydrogenase family enzyme